MFSEFDHQCMSRALVLARKGLLTTDPNPRVGCVLAKDGQVIGEGWHQQAGKAHAEVFALREAGSAASGSTAYVTLEPCNHKGRTDACAPALIKAGVSRVVAATLDPNPRVNGKGVVMLRNAGIEVDVGLAREASDALNAGFNKRMQSGRPFVRAKLALSLDGRTGLHNGDSSWITSEASRNDVQYWRARASVILTGIGTVLHDDPSLDVRLDDKARQPRRVIADSNWRTTVNARTLSRPGDVLIAGLNHAPVPEALERCSAALLRCPAGQDGKVDLGFLMQRLAEMEANEIHVEAGARLTGALLQAGLVDELLIYQAPVLLGSGALDAVTTPVLSEMSERISMRCVESIRTGEDLRSRFVLLPEDG